MAQKEEVINKREGKERSLKKIKGNNKYFQKYIQCRKSTREQFWQQRCEKDTKNMEIAEKLFAVFFMREDMRLKVQPIWLSEEEIGITK